MDWAALGGCAVHGERVGGHGDQKLEDERACGRTRGGCYSQSVWLASEEQGTRGAETVAMGWPGSVGALRVHTTGDAVSPDAVGAQLECAVGAAVGGAEEEDEGDLPR